MIGMEWKIFFDDGRSVVQKQGTIEKQDLSFVYIRVNDKLEAIPVNSITLCTVLFSQFGHISSSSQS
jgi:hypothetical protein